MQIKFEIEKLLQEQMDTLLLIRQKQFSLFHEYVPFPQANLENKLLTWISLRCKNQGELCSNLRSLELFSHLSIRDHKYHKEKLSYLQSSFL